MLLWQTLPFDQKLVLLPSKIGEVPHPDLLRRSAMHGRLREGLPGEGDKPPGSQGLFRKGPSQSTRSKHSPYTSAF